MQRARVDRAVVTVTVQHAVSNCLFPHGKVHVERATDFLKKLQEEAACCVQEHVVRRHQFAAFRVLKMEEIVAGVLLIPSQLCWLTFRSFVWVWNVLIWFLNTWIHLQVNKHKLIENKLRYRFNQSPYKSCSTLLSSAYSRSIVSRRWYKSCKLCRFVHASGLLFCESVLNIDIVLLLNYKFQKKIVLVLDECSTSC